MAQFLAGKSFSASQIEFCDLVVNHLTEHGAMEPSALYESPFTDVAPQGPDVLFRPPEIEDLVRLLENIRATATAA